MSAPDLLGGNRFRAYRSLGGNPETFAFICIAQTKGLTRTNTFEDATVADCDAPLNIPARKSILASTGWSARLAGVVDAKRYRDLENDSLNEAPKRYQFLLDKPAAQGGGTYTGAVFYESLEITSQNNGLVNFTAQLRGDDALVWAAASA